MDHYPSNGPWIPWWDSHPSMIQVKLYNPYRQLMANELRNRRIDETDPNGLKAIIVLLIMKSASVWRVPSGLYAIRISITLICLFNILKKYKGINIKKVNKRLIMFNKLCYSYVYDNLVLVAQWTRARGYEPRCQGFESLLAQVFHCT